MTSTTFYDEFMDAYRWELDWSPVSGCPRVATRHIRDNVREIQVRSESTLMAFLKTLAVVVFGINVGICLWLVFPRQPLRLSSMLVMLPGVVFLGVLSCRLILMVLKDWYPTRYQFDHNTSKMTCYWLPGIVINLDLRDINSIEIRSFNKSGYFHCRVIMRCRPGYRRIVCSTWFTFFIHWNIMYCESIGQRLNCDIYGDRESLRFLQPFVRLLVGLARCESVSRNVHVKISPEDNLDMSHYAEGNSDVNRIR